MIPVSYFPSFFVSSWSCRLSFSSFCFLFSFSLFIFIPPPSDSPPFSLSSLIVFSYLLFIYGTPFVRDWPSYTKNYTTWVGHFNFLTFLPMQNPVLRYLWQGRLFLVSAFLTLRSFQPPRLYGNQFSNLSSRRLVPTSSSFTFVEQKTKKILSLIAPGMSEVSCWSWRTRTRSCSYTKLFSLRRLSGSKCMISREVGSCKCRAHDR